jgi:glucosamine kinase
MPYFLGIDGGGTNTDSAIGDGHNMLGSGTAGTAKIYKVEKAVAAKNLRASVEAALQAAGVQGSQIEHTCVGIAGQSMPGVEEWLIEQLPQMVSGGITIVGDNVIAHRAAFGGGPGVLVIAGTGSIAFGINARGEEARSGGWGPIVSDEGSGTWIGRGAISAMLRAHDARQHTGLRDAILAKWGVTTIDEIVAIANSPKADFPALTPLVTEVARMGDTVALRLLHRAGRALAQLALAIIPRLWALDEDVAVAASGGVIRNSTFIRESFTDMILTEAPNARVISTKIEPVRGALLMAEQAARNMVK